MIGFRLLLSTVEQLRGEEYCTRAVAAVCPNLVRSLHLQLSLCSRSLEARPRWRLENRNFGVWSSFAMSGRCDSIGKHVQHVQGESAQLRPQFRRVSASVGAVTTNAFFVRQISDGETHEVLSSAAEDYVSVAFTNFITTKPRAFPPTNGLHYVPAWRAATVCGEAGVCLCV